MKTLTESIRSEQERTNQVFETTMTRLDSIVTKMENLERLIAEIQIELTTPLNPIQRGLNGILNDGPKESVKNIQSDVAEIIAEHEAKTGRKLHTMNPNARD